MTIWEYIVGAVIILFALIVIAVILLQEGRQANLGAIAGAAESFMDKGKARTLDAFLSRWTKIIAIIFFLLVLAGMLITEFLGAK
ncbi:MAG: preprotein translocase subunit SecG [Clostridia bacterium]|nr:preprotein translocase subunit SecG [Clostridia bacterium]